MPFTRNEFILRKISLRLETYQSPIQDGFIITEQLFDEGWQRMNLSLSFIHFLGSACSTSLLFCPWIEPKQYNLNSRTVIRYPKAKGLSTTVRRDLHEVYDQLYRDFAKEKRKSSYMSRLAHGKHTLDPLTFRRVTALVEAIQSSISEEESKLRGGVKYAPMRSIFCF